MKIFNKQIYIAGLLLGFVIIIVGIIIGFYTPTEKKSIYNSKSDVVENIDNSYILKEYQGKVGVFKNNQSEPIFIINVFVNTLPDYDVESLKNGIYIKDEAELSKIIEDFES